MHAESRSPALASKSGAVLVSTTQPTNAVDPIAFFTRANATDSRALWLRPASGEALVGIGSAWALTGFGVARFRQIAAAWRSLVQDARINGPGPLLLGGFSFDPACQSTALWDGFPDARLVLPEQMLAVRGSAAWLTTNEIVGARAHEQADKPRRLPHATGLTPTAWKALTASVAASIRSGALGGMRKVVLARAETGRPTRSIEAALKALSTDYPGCTIFAFTHGEACFLGASPERLISLHHGNATTMALAGTAPRGQTPAEDRQLAECLLADPKERIEHALVVEALREGLESVSTRVIVDATPRVRALSNVHHLMTSICADVEPGRTVLDLVERLHPSPAVGGLPRGRATRLIRDSEALDRGWYAAPIGWMDARGDGEFVVGLRSALVRGEEATLLAGCGIVGYSDPDTELAELGWKLRAMRDALGVS